MELQVIFHTTISQLCLHKLVSKNLQSCDPGDCLFKEKKASVTEFVTCDTSMKRDYKNTMQATILRLSLADIIR